MLARVAAFAFCSAVFCWVAHGSSAPGGAALDRPAWLPTARVVLWVSLACGVGMVFILERALLGEAAPQLRARGLLPDELLVTLAMGVGLLSVVAAVVLLFAGGEASDVYATTVVAIAMLVFWCWRFRHIFRSNPPAP